MYKLQELIKKVLREESSINNNLKGMIDRYGFKNAAKAVGGGKKLMNILNLEGEELDEFIYQYLTNNLYPDYNWGPEDYSLHQQYKRDIKSYGTHAFNVNDEEAYHYFGEWDGYDYLSLLVISKWVRNELTSLFGDKWVPVFKRWFEYNSGLKVREIDLEGRFLHEY
jgi:hypothetical protein